MPFMLISLVTHPSSSLGPCDRAVMLATCVTGAAEFWEEEEEALTLDTPAEAPGGAAEAQDEQGYEDLVKLRVVSGAWGGCWGGGGDGAWGGWSLGGWNQRSYLSRIDSFFNC